MGDCGKYKQVQQIYSAYVWQMLRQYILWNFTPIYIVVHNIATKGAKADNPLTKGYMLSAQLAKGHSRPSIDE